jgi:hypothetical protein
MTELVLKNKIDRKKLDSIIIFLKSWGIDAEIKTTTKTKTVDTKELFSESFGMWAGRDIDIKKIRQKSFERRTKSYDNGTL